MRVLSLSIVIAAAAILSNTRLPAVRSAAAAAPTSISGTVALDGAAPKRSPINMAKEPGCAAMHKTPPLAEDVVTGPNGALKNVVIYVAEGLPDSNWTPPQEPVVLNQSGCSYEPHVVALQAGQTLRIVNSDKTSHNIHPMPSGNREWNKSQPPGSPAFEETFGRQEVGIPVKCNVHSWMRAYISVFRHPYFAVSNDSGTFQIRNLPPGTYTINAWHEKLGIASQKVTVAAGESKALQFEFKSRAGI